MLRQISGICGLSRPVQINPCLVNEAFMVDTGVIISQFVLQTENISSIIAVQNLLGHAPNLELVYAAII